MGIGSMRPGVTRKNPGGRVACARLSLGHLPSDSGQVRRISVRKHPEQVALLQAEADRVGAEGAARDLVEVRQQRARRRPPVGTEDQERRAPPGALLPVATRTSRALRARSRWPIAMATASGHGSSVRLSG